MVFPAFLAALPLGKIATYVGIGVFILALLFGAVKMYEAQVKSAALAQHNAIQLEKVLEDQKKFNDIQTAVRNKQDEIIADLIKQREQLKEQHSSFKEFLRSDKIKTQDKEVSPVIKESYEYLRGNH